MITNLAAHLAALSLFSLPAGAIDIPAGPLRETANEWSRQTGLQILFDFYDAAGVATAPARGPLQPMVALAVMLAPTGWDFELVNDRTLALLPGIPTCAPDLPPTIAPLPPCLPPSLKVHR